MEELLSKAWSLRRVGKYDQARKILSKAQSICPADDYHSLGRIFHILMQFESDHQRYQEALPFCEQSLAYYQKANDLDRIAHATRHQADLERKLEKFALAESHYQACIKMYRKRDPIHAGDLANALRGYALLLESLGKNSTSNRHVEGSQKTLSGMSYSSRCR